MRLRDLATLIAGEFVRFNADRVIDGSRLPSVMLACLHFYLEK